MVVTHKSGFTLIELSIVLVIIGLIAGGIVAGQDLIEVAAVRAQVAQIEKYDTAVNTFRVKYAYLPGDIPEPNATAIGFTPRGQYAGEGDGNGMIEGDCSDIIACGPCGFCISIGEGLLFWEDLGIANLIEQPLNSAVANLSPNAQGTAVAQYLPHAKIGNGNYVYVWSGGSSGGWQGNGDGRIYFGISAVTQLYAWYAVSSPALTILQAFNIDTKIDDGMPQSGRVMAWYYTYPLENFSPTWAAGGGTEGTNVWHGPSQTATPASATSCYDNAGVAGAQQHYSTGYGAGTAMNCALSFRFQ
jgi:prepilin-type N-terminal cleavage/methylation domain-containing protein